MSEVSEQVQALSDKVGFFTVMRLVLVIVAVMTPLLAVHTLVMKGLVAGLVDEKMNQFAVAKIEYEVRRVDMDKNLVRLEAADASMASKLQHIDERLRDVEQDIKTLRERQDQVRLKLHLNGQ